MAFPCPSLIRVLPTALAVLALGASAAGVEQNIPGPVPARVLGVVDGDTVIVRARIWLGQEVETRVRLRGVDAPEIKGRCEAERRLAARARDFALAKLGDGPVVLTDVQYGKYAGRVVARIRTADGEDLAAALVTAGLGRPYAGGRRESWCPG